MLLSPYRLTLLLYRPTEGGRLSRPRHYSKCAQPVPKAVYCSGCRDKHIRPRCDSNLGPLTPQSDALTTRPLHLSNVPFPSLERAHRRDMYWTPNLVTDAPCSCIPPTTQSAARTGRHAAAMLTKAAITLSTCWRLRVLQDLTQRTARYLVSCFDVMIVDSSSK